MTLTENEKRALSGEWMAHSDKMKALESTLKKVRKLLK